MFWSLMLERQLPGLPLKLQALRENWGISSSFSVFSQVAVPRELAQSSTFLCVLASGHRMPSHAIDSLNHPTDPKEPDWWHLNVKKNSEGPTRKITGPRDLVYKMAFENPPHLWIILSTLTRKSFIPRNLCLQNDRMTTIHWRKWRSLSSKP